MGIQTLVVFIGVATAVGVGLLTVLSGASPRAAGLIAVGFALLMWALTGLIERLIGHEIWQYSAPYPYRGMDVAPSNDRPAVTSEPVGTELREERYPLVEAA
jgi:hypothetical protein